MIITDSILEGCRQKLGPVPRRFSLWARWTYLPVQKPLWCNGQEPLKYFFAGQKKLLEEGRVVWGHLIQANGLLFKPGPHNCPGEVVYCVDTRQHLGPEDLAPIASSLYALKGVRCPSSDLQVISDYLANERQRVFGLEVPAAISPSAPCAISTVFFDRQHLPGRMLRSTYFPILISPSRPRIAMVVPSRFWPEAMRVIWN